MQDHGNHGDTSMLYGLDRRDSGVLNDTDLGVARFMIEQGELERCERKYINMEEPVKIIDGAKALNLQTQNRVSEPESHDAARMDIGGKDLQEVIAELSTLRESVSSIDQNVLGMVSDYANKMSSTANLSSHDNTFLSLLDRAKINSPDAKDSLMALSAVSQPNSVGGQAIVEANYDWDNQRQVKVVKKSGRTEINPHSHRMDASIAAAVLNGQREWTDLRDATAESGSLQTEYSYGFQVVKEVSREASKWSRINKNSKYNKKNKRYFIRPLLFKFFNHCDFLKRSL